MIDLQNMTDEQLAIAYSNGSNAAFDVLLQRTKNSIFSYILYVVHDQELANDIFQETFVKAIMYLQKGKYSTTGKFTSWIMRISHNIIMDYYRHSKIANIVDNGQNNDISNFSELDLSREAIYVNEQVYSDVKHIMSFLPAPQREVVHMRYYQNMSFKEIAESTGVSINTALGRMRYAIMNMRKMAKNNNIQLDTE